MSAVLTKLAIRFLFKEAVRVFILPIAIPILVGVIGWFQDIPWFYLCVGVGLLFAAVFHRIIAIRRVGGIEIE